MKPNLPWSTQKFKRNDGTEGIQILDSKGVVIACNETYYPTALDAEHAEIITEAVNSHFGERIEVWTEYVTPHVVYIRQAADQTFRPEVDGQVMSMRPLTKRETDESLF